MNKAIESLMQALNTEQSDGKSDSVEARLSEGEYVLPANVVAELGNGSTSAGARILDNFVKNIGIPEKPQQEDTRINNPQKGTLDGLTTALQELTGTGASPTEQVLLDDYLKEYGPSVDDVYAGLLNRIFKERGSE